MTTLWWVLLLAPYLAFAAIRLRAWIRERRRSREQALRDAERQARLPVTDGAGIVFRNFSVYVDADKLGTAEAHSFRMTESETTLTVNQIVPSDHRVFGSALIRDAFVADNKVQISLGLIDGEMLSLGAMSVTNISYSTSCKTGVTRMVASLVGATLKKPQPERCTVYDFAEKQAVDAGLAVGDGAKP